jgi:hypothetical protein
MISVQLQEAVASYLGRTWDIQKAAKELPRFEFVVQFVARETRTKKGRDLVDGYQVIKTPKGWTYVNEQNPKLHLAQPTTADRLFDTIRRTALGYYTRKGDELRVAAFQEEREPTAKDTLDAAEPYLGKVPTELKWLMKTLHAKARKERSADGSSFMMARPKSWASKVQHYLFRVERGDAPQPGFGQVVSGRADVVRYESRAGNLTMTSAGRQSAPIRFVYNSMVGDVTDHMNLG